MKKKKKTLGLHDTPGHGLTVAEQSKEDLMQETLLLKGRQARVSRPRGIRPFTLASTTGASPKSPLRLYYKRTRIPSAPVASPEPIRTLMVIPIWFLWRMRLRVINGLRSRDVARYSAVFNLKQRSCHWD